MKQFLSILLLTITTSVYCQTDEIYRLAFSDKSNFKLLNFLDHKRPKEILIIDTTQTWNIKRFWLDDVNLKSSEVLKDISSDEHHPYYHSYLFRDTILDKIIHDTEKKALSKRARELKTHNISLKGKSYKTIHSSNNIKGFYIVSAQPVFSTDMKYAFIDLAVFHKDTVEEEQSESYFGKICIVYQRQLDNNWKKIKVAEWLIL
jgi:hypothetical protein